MNRGERFWRARRREKSSNTHFVASDTHARLVCWWVSSYSLLLFHCPWRALAVLMASVKSLERVPLLMAIVKVRDNRLVHYRLSLLNILPYTPYL